MPDIWVTGRPATATGGSARTLMRETIERAAAKIVARQMSQKAKRKTFARKRARR